MTYDGSAGAHRHTVEGLPRVTQNARRVSTRAALWATGALGSILPLVLIVTH